MFSKNVFGIDLGTSAVKIYSLRKNRLLVEHHMIAIRDGAQVIAVGDDAYEMYEKNPPGIVIERPVRDGRIADVSEVDMVLNLLLRKTDLVSAKRPVVCFSTPVNMSELERRAYYAVSEGSDLRRPSVYLADRPICDAIAMGVPLEHSRGSMILDIGAESTEVSVIAGGQIIISDRLPFGGQDLNEVIADEIRRSRNLLIGMKTARRLKISLATLETREDEKRVVTGIDTLSGLPRKEEISSRLISAAVLERLTAGAEEIRTFLGRIPPQVRDSVVSEGVYLTGGTARIPGIEHFMMRILGCRIHLSSDYELSTVRGLEKMIKDTELKKWTRSIRDRK